MPRKRGKKRHVVHGIRYGPWSSDTRVTPLPMLLADCCGHAEDAHDELGCLVNGCGCVRGGASERTLDLHEVARLFRIRTETLDGYISDGVLTSVCDEEGRTCLRGDQLPILKARLERGGLA